MGEIDLDQAFRQYSPYVARICIRLLGRDSDVDDCVQQVFLIAAKGVSRIRDPEALKGWLATVAVRVARKRIRARRFKAFLHLDETPEYDRLAAPGATPEERAMLSRVYAALDGFPADDRTAWLLRYVEGEKLERVAELCDCSLATAKRRIARAHQTLSKVIGDGTVSSGDPKPPVALSEEKAKLEGAE